LCAIVCAGPVHAESTLSPELKATLKDLFTNSPHSQAAKIVVPADEAVLQLEPFKVTDSTDFQLDIVRAARQRAAAKAARQFSFLKGGLLHSWTMGARQIDLGIWPMLVSPNDQLSYRLALNQETLRIRVDLLRIKW